MKCDFCHKTINKKKRQPVCFDWGWLERPQEPNQVIPKKDLQVECYCDPTCFMKAMEKSGRLKDYQNQCIERSGLSEKADKRADLKLKRNFGN